MAQGVTVSPRAHADLLEITRYIGVDSPESAIAFGDKLLDRAEQLLQFPRSGRIVPEFPRENLRELTHQSIRIIYVIRPNGSIEILRFWHAARGNPLL